MRFQIFFRLKAQFYTLNLILLHFHRNIDKFRACLANYLLFFRMKLQKNAVFALCCEISVAEVKLRFNLVRKYCFAIAGLRCASTESKISLRKLRCASEIKKIKLRILRCAFTGWKNRCALLRCAFDILLVVPTYVNISNKTVLKMPAYSENTQTQRICFEIGNQWQAV